MGAKITFAFIIIGVDIITFVDDENTKATKTTKN